MIGMMKMKNKEKIYKAILILKKNFPDYDFCIVGSSSLYLRGINYKIPHDLDIVILNENHSEKNHEDYKNIVSMCAYKKTGLKIDALDLNHGNFDYDIIKLMDKDIKCITINDYIKMKRKFSEDQKLNKYKRDKHLKDLEALENIIKDYESRKNNTDTD